jgi:hypothetical protein
MELITPNGVKIYNVSAGKTLPEWIAEKKKGKSLKKNAGTSLFSPPHQYFSFRF